MSLNINSAEDCNLGGWDRRDNWFNQWIGQVRDLRSNHNAFPLSRYPCCCKTGVKFLYSWYVVAIIVNPVERIDEMTKRAARGLLSRLLEWGSLRPSILFDVVKLSYSATGIGITTSSSSNRKDKLVCVSGEAVFTSRVFQSLKILGYSSASDPDEFIVWEGIDIVLGLNDGIKAEIDIVIFEFLTNLSLFIVDVERMNLISLNFTASKTEN